METTSQIALALDAPSYGAYGIETSSRGRLARVRVGRWVAGAYVPERSVTVETYPAIMPAPKLASHLADGIRPWACGARLDQSWDAAARAAVEWVGDRQCMTCLRLVAVEGQ